MYKLKYTGHVAMPTIAIDGKRYQDGECIVFTDDEKKVNLKRIKSQIPKDWDLVNTKVKEENK